MTLFGRAGITKMFLNWTALLIYDGTDNPNNVPNRRDNHS